MFIIQMLMAASLVAVSIPDETLWASVDEWTDIGDRGDYVGTFGPENTLARSMSWHWDASSELAPQGDFDYWEENLADLDRNTAWVEGVSGQGEGETLEATFYRSPGGDGEEARCWGMVILSGYAKSRTAWEDNSRVRSMVLSLNGEPLYLLELEDTMQPQSFYWNDHDEVLYLDDSDEIELTIVSVYPGNRWEDTAITEIAFLGGGRPTND